MVSGFFAPMSFSVRIVGCGGRTRFAFSPQAKIEVETSVCTGFSKCPPDTCSAMGSSPVLCEKRKEKSHPDWDDFFFSGCGGRTRTYDLRVMSPTSFQLLYSAILMPQVPKYCTTERQLCQPSFWQQIQTFFGAADSAAPDILSLLYNTFYDRVHLIPLALHILHQLKLGTATVQVLTRSAVGKIVVTVYVVG